MLQVQTAFERRSNNSIEQTCRFGTIVRALWPDKPALNLSQRLGCSERAAQFYIDGERKISARCVQAIVNEILS